MKNIRFNIHLLPRFLSIILALTLLSLSCQPTNAYGARYNKCFEKVKITEFDIEVEGATKKGFGYSGFNSRCLLGARLPSFETKDINGEEIDAGNLLGKITLINFWFIKCAPCIAEIPRLNAIVEKYGKQEVNYLAISRDPEQEVEEFLKKNTFLFTHVPNAEQIIEENFRLIWGYPSTIVVDRKGRIVEIYEGAKLKSDPSIDVTTAVDSLLTDLLQI